MEKIIECGRKMVNILLYFVFTLFKMVSVESYCLISIIMQVYNWALLIKSSTQISFLKKKIQSTIN